MRSIHPCEPFITLSCEAALFISECCRYDSEIVWYIEQKFFDEAKERGTMKKESKDNTSPNDFLERLQNKEDYPASLEEHLDWLRCAGLSATCLHLHLHRALIAGKKGEET